MHEVERIRVVAPRARSLVWSGDELYDVAAGWQRLEPHGRSRRTAYGPGFDHAVTAPRGDLVALVASLGTKALLLRPDGAVSRELSRSFYQAHAYRYPLALFTLPDGRTGLVHCPDAYNRLEIEVAETGERLTRAGDRDLADFFHSRLDVSDDGRLLLSAGWYWHPFGELALIDIAAALADPRALDRGGNDERGTAFPVDAEVSSACFVGCDVVLATSSELLGHEDAGLLGVSRLARWSTAERQFRWEQPCGPAVADLVRFGNGVLALGDRLRWFDADTGELGAEWPDLSTGRAGELGAIPGSDPWVGTSRITVHPTEPWFAVAGEEAVTVVCCAS